MMTDNEFEVYKSLESDLQQAQEMIGNIQNLSSLWPGNKRRLQDLLTARQNLHNFLENRRQTNKE